MPRRSTSQQRPSVPVAVDAAGPSPPETCPPLHALSDATTTVSPSSRLAASTASAADARGSLNAGVPTTEFPPRQPPPSTRQRRPHAANAVEGSHTAAAVGVHLHGSASTISIPLLQSHSVKADGRVGSGSGNNGSSNSCSSRHRSSTSPVSAASSSSRAEGHSNTTATLSSASPLHQEQGSDSDGGLAPSSRGPWRQGRRGSFHRHTTESRQRGEEERKDNNNNNNDDDDDGEVVHTAHRPMKRHATAPLMSLPFMLNRRTRTDAPTPSPAPAASLSNAERTTAADSLDFTLTSNATLLQQRGRVAVADAMEDVSGEAMVATLAPRRTNTMVTLPTQRRLQEQQQQQRSGQHHSTQPAGGSTRRTPRWGTEEALSLVSPSTLVLAQPQPSKRAARGTLQDSYDSLMLESIPRVSSASTTAGGTTADSVMNASKPAVRRSHERRASPGASLESDVDAVRRNRRARDEERPAAAPSLLLSLLSVSNTEGGSCQPQARVRTCNNKKRVAQQQQQQRRVEGGEGRAEGGVSAGNSAASVSDAVSASTTSSTTPTATRATQQRRQGGGKRGKKGRNTTTDTDTDRRVVAPPAAQHHQHDHRGDAASTAHSGRSEGVVSGSLGSSHYGRKRAPVSGAGDDDAGGRSRRPSATEPVLAGTTPAAAAAAAEKKRQEQGVGVSRRTSATKKKAKKNAEGRRGAAMEDRSVGAQGPTNTAEKRTKKANRRRGSALKQQEAEEAPPDTYGKTAFAHASDTHASALSASSSASASGSVSALPVEASCDDGDLSVAASAVSSSSSSLLSSPSSMLLPSTRLAAPQRTRKTTLTTQSKQRQRSSRVAAERRESTSMSRSGSDPATAAASGAAEFTTVRVPPRSHLPRKAPALSPRQTGLPLLSFPAVLTEKATTPLGQRRKAQPVSTSTSISASTSTNSSSHATTLSAVSPGSQACPTPAAAAGGGGGRRRGVGKCDYPQPQQQLNDEHHQSLSAVVRRVSVQQQQQQHRLSYASTFLVSSLSSGPSQSTLNDTLTTAIVAAAVASSSLSPPPPPQSVSATHSPHRLVDASTPDATTTTAATSPSRGGEEAPHGMSSGEQPMSAVRAHPLPSIPVLSSATISAPTAAAPTTTTAATGVLTKGAPGREETDAAASTTPLDTNPHTPKSRQPSFTRSRGQLQAKPPARSPSPSSSASTSFSRSLVSSGTPQSAEQLTPLPVPHEFMRSAGGDRAAQHYSQSQQNPQQARSTTFMMPLMRFASRDSSSTTSSPPPPPPAPPPPESPLQSAAPAGQQEHEKSATSAGNHCPGRVDERSSGARRQGQASGGRLVPLSDNTQSPTLPDPRFLRSPLFAADRSGEECALSLDTLGVAAATALPHTQIEEDDDGIGQTRAFPLHEVAAGESTASASLTAPQVIARVLFASATPAAATAVSDTSHSRFPQPQQQEKEMDLGRQGQQRSLTSFSDTLLEETTTAAAAAAALASTCKGVDAAAAPPPPDLKAENPSLRSTGSDGVNDSSMSSFAAPPRSPLELNRSRLRTAGSVAITTRIGHHGEPTSAVASPLLVTTTTTATTTVVARGSGGRRPVTPPTYVSPLGTSPLPRGGAMGRSPLPFHSVARASGGASPLPLPRGAAASMALVNANGCSAPLSGGSSPLTLAAATAQPGTPPLAPQHVATVMRTSVNASLATSNSLSAFTLAVNGGRGQGGFAGTGSSGNGSGGGGGVEVLRESGSGSSSQLCAPVAAAGAADPRASSSVFSSSSVTAITPLVAVRAASPVFPSLGFAPHSGRGVGSQGRGGAGSNHNSSSSPHPPFAVVGSAAAAAAAVVPSSSLHNTSQLLSHHRLVNSFSTTSSMGAFVLQSSNTALLMRNGVPHGTTQVALPDRSGESGTLSASDDMLTGGHALLASFTQRSASRGRQLSRRGTALSVKHPSFVRRGHRRSLLPPGTAIELAIRNGGYSRRPSTLSVMPGGGGHAGAMVTSGGLGRSRNVSALYHSWGDAEPMDVSLSCAATITATPTSASVSYISSSFGSVSQVLSAPRHNSASGALTADGAGSAVSAATRVTSNTTGEIIHNSISISGSSASAGVATARTQAAVHTSAPPKAASVTLLHTNAGGSDKAGMSRELWNAEGNNDDHHHQQQKADSERSDQLPSPTGPSCVLYSTAPRRYHFYRLKKKTTTSTAATKSNNPDVLCSHPHSGDANQRQHSLEKTYTSPLQLPRYQQGFHGGLAVASTLSPNEGGLTPSQQQPQPTRREREKRHHRYVRIHHRKHTSQLPLPSLRDTKGDAATRSVEEDGATEAAAVAAEGEQEAVKMEGGDVAASGMNARRMEDRDAEAHSNSNSSSTAPPSAAVGRQQLNNTAAAVDSTAHDHSSSIRDSPHRLTLSPPPSASQQQQEQQRVIYSPHLSTSSLLYYDDVDSDAVDDVYYQLEKRLFPVKAEQALQARKASLLSASACSHRLYVPPLTTESKATTPAAAEVAGMSGDTVPSTTAAAAAKEAPTAVDTQSKITSLFTVLDVPLRLNLRGGFHLSDYYAPCPICHPVMTKLAAAAAAAAAADISTSTLTDSDEIVSAELSRGSDGSNSSNDDDDDADESDLCSCSDCSNCGSRSPAAVRSRRRRNSSSSRGKQRRAAARGASLSSSTVTSRRSSETATTTHTRSSASAASSVISATGIGFAFHSGAGLTGEGFSPPPPPSTLCAAAATAVPMRTLPLSSATATVGSTTVTDLTSSPRTATHLGANASAAVATTPRQQSSTVAAAATTSAATPVTVHRVDSLRSLSGAPLMAQVFSGRRSHRNSISGLTPLTTATTTAATATGGGGSMNGSTGRTNNVTIVSPTRESKERPFAHSPPWSPTDIPAPPQRLKTEAADKSARPHNPASASATATVVQEGEEEKNAAAMNRSASSGGAAALTAQPIPTILQRGGSTVSSSMLRTAPTAEVPVTHQQLNTPTLCPALPSPPPFGLGPLPTLGGGAHSAAGSQLIQLSHARIMSSRRESRSQGTGLGTATAASVAAAAAAATTSSTSGLATKHASRYRRVRPRHRPAMVVARRRGYRGGPGGNGALRSQYSSFMKQRLLCLRINDKLTYIDPKRATGAAKLVADAALLAERLKRDEEKRMRQQREKEERRRQRKKTAAAAAESAAGQRERLSDTNDALGEQGGEDGADKDATVPDFAAPRLYCPRCYWRCHRSHRRHHHSGHSQQQQQQQRHSPHSSLLHPTDAASQEQREEAKLERLSHPQSNRPRSAMASRPAVPQRHHSQRHSHSSKHKEKQQAHAQDSKQQRQAKRLASPDSSDVLSQNISGQWMLHGMPALARVTEQEQDVESMRSGSVHTSQQQHHHRHHQDEQQPFGGGLACFAAQHSPAPKNAHAAARSFADSLGNATQRPPESATTSAVKSTTTAAAKSIASVHGFAVTSESPPRPQRLALVSRTAGRPSPPQPLQRHVSASSCHGTAAARHSSDAPGTPVISFCALASASADAVACDGQSEGSRHLTLHSEQTSWQYRRGGKDSNGEERSRGGGGGDDQGTLTAGPMTVLHSADGAVVSLSPSASAGAAAVAGDGVRFTALSPPPPPTALAAVAEGETLTTVDCISATDTPANVAEAVERLVASAVLNNTLYSTPLSRDMDGFPELEGRSLGSVHVPRSRTSSVHHSRPWANNVTAVSASAAAAVVSGGESGASVTASRAEWCDDGRRGVGAGQSSMEKSELLRQSSGSSVLAAPAAFLAFPTNHTSARNNNNNNSSGRSSVGKNATPDLPCYTEGSFRFASENRQPSRGARYGGTASSSSMLPLGSPSAPAESGYVVHSRSASHSAVLPLQESAAPHLSAQHQPPQPTPQYPQQQQQLSQPQLRQRRYRSRSRPSRSGSQSARHRSSMTSFTVHYHPPQHHRRVSSSMSGAPDAEMTEEEMLNTALAAYPDFTPRSDSRAPSGRH